MAIYRALNSQKFYRVRAMCGMEIAMLDGLPFAGTSSLFVCLFERNLMLFEAKR